MSHSAIVQLRYLKSNYSSSEKAIYSLPAYPGQKIPHWVISLKNPVKQVWWHPLQHDLNATHKVNQFNKKNVLQLVMEIRMNDQATLPRWLNPTEKELPCLYRWSRTSHYLLPCLQHHPSVNWGRGMSNPKLNPSHTLISLQISIAQVIRNKYMSKLIQWS